MTLKLNRNGRIVFNPLLGPYNSYPEGSEQWHVAFSRSVQSEFDRMQFERPGMVPAASRRAFRAGALRSGQPCKGEFLSPCEVRLML
jgi:hypothetical protein